MERNNSNSDSEEAAPLPAKKNRLGVVANRRGGVAPTVARHARSGLNLLD